MSKKPYTVFEPVGFTEPIPGLRAATRPAAGAVVTATGKPRESMQATALQSVARDARPAARGLGAPLATGAVLLAMAGAGWAMLQASSPPPIEIPPRAELAVPPAAGDALSALAPSNERPLADSFVKPVDGSVNAPAATPAAQPELAAPTAPTKPAGASSKTASAKHSGDLLQGLAAPAAGQPVSRAALLRPEEPAPVALPVAPPVQPASAPAPIPAEPKTEVPAIAAPQPPASAASS